MQAFFFNWFKGNRPAISHKTSDTIHLNLIEDNVDFMRDGNGSTIVTGDVGKNVKITISENSNLEIRGTIGQECKIYKDGSGTLTISGSVANDLDLTIYGQGKVIFVQRPPESVIRSIKMRSVSANIICAGVSLGLSSQGYRRHNLGTPFIESPVTIQPVPIIQSVHPSPSVAPVSSNGAARALNQLSQEKSNAPVPTIDKGDEYNPLTKEYIEYYQSRKLKTVEERINELNLTTEETPLFEKFLDCIMMSYFSDIPVMYDEKYYNLCTLLQFHENKNTDPFSRKPIRLAGISSARHILDDLDNAIAALNKKREEAAKQKDNSNTHAEPPKTLSM